MSIASRISALASRVGLEVKTKIDAAHPGLARAWVCFGYVGTQIVVRAVLRVPAGTDETKAVQLVQRAEHVCLISNSLVAERSIEATVSFA